MLQRIQELLESGVDRRQIIFINFEDDRITPIVESQLDLILTAHGELYPELQQKKRYYFFDEVQNAHGWERFCRRIYDTENAEIVVTGSSSHFLAKEVATALRGRSLPIEVFPLSFAEFLQFRQVELEEYSPLSEQRAVSELEEYLRIGGLPEVVLATATVRPLIIKEYTDLLLYKDLVDRYRLTNPVLMKELLRTCLAAPASLINVVKVFHDLQSRGLKISKDTVYRYLDILQESYLLFLSPVAEKSIRKRAINPKKMHLVDWSLGYSYMPEVLIDRGHKLENAVFLHERRKTAELGYRLRPHEIDIVSTLDHPQCLINVCWSLSDKNTRERELRALEENTLPHATKILVAHEEVNQEFAAGKNIKIISAWRYLLQK